MNEAVSLRTVSRFQEPAFTELADRLLHDPDRWPVTLKSAPRVWLKKTPLVNCNAPGHD